jgi:hypothetical protein
MAMRNWLLVALLPLVYALKLSETSCSIGKSLSYGRMPVSARNQLEPRFHLSLRGGGNTLGGTDGEALTEEQVGEELIKAATSGDVHGLEPAGIEYLVQAGAPVNYQVHNK